MPRLRLIGLAVGAATAALTSAATAGPLVPPLLLDSNVGATQVQYYSMYGCPPGYRVTSYGGCKLSHYLRRHPYQRPDYYGYYRYNRPHYYHRYYYNPYNSNEDGDWND
ncbi:hypothetical protein GCM10007874_25450 [Labrys miyagiensis]|uniref:Secreted protein n=1 Tax=Labrys miyagiensis TaxID=346912 RepID=A0ABQ6CGX7_9HYPH|nr:hypothetical protein GCM10007874_25450 [Labrys miyagiensis]